MSTSWLIWHSSQHACGTCVRFRECLHRMSVSRNGCSSGLRCALWRSAAVLSEISLNIVVLPLRDGAALVLTVTF